MRIQATNYEYGNIVGSPPSQAAIEYLNKYHQIAQSQYLQRTSNRSDSQLISRYNQVQSDIDVCQKEMFGNKEIQRSFHFFGLKNMLSTELESLAGELTSRGYIYYEGEWRIFL